MKCLEVLEHLPVPIYEIALKELSRISRKYVIISVPYQEKIEDSYTKCPQCLTIFNHELHLRKYEKIDLEKLLVKNNFLCISSQTLGDCENYYGHDLFRKVFYPEQIMQWHSTMCPVCGYSESIEKTNNSKQKVIVEKKNIISKLTSIPKLFWPKQKRHYWILSLFEKK